MITGFTPEKLEATAARWANFAALVQLVIAASVVGIWANADHYGTHHMTMTNRLSGGLLCGAFVLLFGRRLVRESRQVRHPRLANRAGYVLVLTVCAVVAFEADQLGHVFWLIAALIATSLTCGFAAVRTGELLLPRDERGSWQQIHGNAFFAAWEDLTTDRTEAIIQDTTDSRVMLWTLPLDITGHLYDEPLPFTAVLGPIDNPLAFYRFTLDTDRQEAGR